MASLIYAVNEHNRLIFKVHIHLKPIFYRAQIYITPLFAFLNK